MYLIMRRPFLVPFIVVLLNFSQMPSLNAPTSAHTQSANFIPQVFERGLGHGLTAIRSADPSPALSLSSVQSLKEQILTLYGRTIKQHARLYGLDWRLVLAVIQQESSFRINAVSEAGARGLMQIMPRTATDLASELGLKDLTNPRHNIQGGALYLSRLYNQFEKASLNDRLCLALAAYNAGPGRILDAQQIAIYLGENPNSWDTIQRMLPLLTKSHYTLHRWVWTDGKPRFGYFTDPNQTVSYVRSVFSNYTGDQGG